MSLLSINNLHVAYGCIQALHGVDLDVPGGKIVAILGANGAGKSTTLRAVSRLIPSTRGDILYQGQSITRRRPHEVVQMGISHVPEGRGIFPNFTVEENLQ